ncbi:MAG TPA: hypothetical protein VKK61_06640, partial [Tepidisphaeraceae bacterium]|nr:hypothetical protein [Tepidisphaeraceae bacterium]
MYAFLTALILLAPIAAAQTKPISESQRRFDEIQHLQADAAALPQFKATSIQQVVKFGIDQNMLAVRTSITSIDGPAHVIIPDLHGIVRLTLFGREDRASLGRNFQLLEQDLTDPAGSEIYTMISAVSGRVLISRD